MTDATLPRPEVRARSAATDLALVATGAALVAVCSLLAAPVGPAGAPITLQTFAVLLVGALLGPVRGALAVALYLAVGFAGLPVFAGATGGPGSFGKVTIGYLLAFPLAAAVVGLLVQRFGRRAWAPSALLIAGAGVVGTLVIYAIGVPVLAQRAGLTFTEALVGNLVFVPFDLVKIAMVAVVAAAVHRAFPDLLDRDRT